MNLSLPQTKRLLFMNWFVRFLTSSIGQKLVMSLSGLFLISFLVIHLIGNLQLLVPDGGQTFNLYAKMMTTNPLIKTVSYLLYGSIALHAVLGLLLWQQNKSASGGASRYAVGTPKTTVTSRNMATLGSIMGIFLIIHMYQFWLKMKLGWTEMVRYEGYDYEVKNLYEIVDIAFSNPLYVIFYVVCMIAVGMHLHHGFQSAFQTLGLNHRKYTPLIKFVGSAISVVIAAGFAIIPIWFYFQDIFNL